MNSTIINSKTLNHYVDEYRRLGLIPLPLAKGDKNPRVKSKPYLDGEVTEEELDAIDWQSGNVGIVTGKTSGIIALDTDPDKETNTHGEDTLKTQGWYIPDGTPTIKSANGYKYIFTYPAGVDNISNAIKFAPGLDLKFLLSLLSLLLLILCGV